MADVIPIRAEVQDAPMQSFHEPLPTAWKAALQFCPFCSGTGSADERACGRCEGTGDLFGTMLRHARKQGMEEGLLKLGQVRNVVALAIDQLEEAPVDTAELKRSVGA